MEKMSVKKSCLFLAVMAVLLVVCAFGIVNGGKISPEASADSISDEIVISADSGFYRKDVEVRVTAPGDARVYYTVDCAEPGPESGQAYEAPILLRAEDEEAVYVLRFRAVYADGAASEIFTRTYFVGKISGTDTVPPCSASWGSRRGFLAMRRAFWCPEPNMTNL